MPYHNFQISPELELNLLLVEGTQSFEGQSLAFVHHFVLINNMDHNYMCSSSFMHK